MPSEVFEDPQSAEAFRQAGIQLNSRNNYVAKFRDPKTAEALKGASEQVKAYFESCGFAFIPSGVSLPEGKFDARFGGHLADVMTRMTENMSKFDLPKSTKGSGPWNGFEIDEAIFWLAQSEPINCAPVPVKKKRSLWARASLILRIVILVLMAWILSQYI